MKAVNIDWVIDVDEALERLDEMTYQTAAEKLSISADTYANMSTSERHDYACDVWHHDPAELEEFMELPDEVEIPSEIDSDVCGDAYEQVVTDWLADTYGYYINGYDLV